MKFEEALYEFVVKGGFARKYPGGVIHWDLEDLEKEFFVNG